MGQLDARPTGDQEVWSPPGRQHSFVEIWSWNVICDHSLPSSVKKGICQFLAKDGAQYWFTA